MSVGLGDSQRKNEPVLVNVRRISDLEGRAKEIHELIAQRAYAIYESNGCINGYDKEDWRQAESEVLAFLCMGCIELNGHLTVDIGATVSELSALQVAIEPRQLIVSGKKSVTDAQRSRDPEKPAAPVEIFQALEFPVEVDPARARATFANGLLEFKLPKAEEKSKWMAAKAVA